MTPEEAGRLGGEERKRRLSPERRREIAVRAAQTRRAKERGRRVVLGWIGVRAAVGDTAMRA